MASDILFEQDQGQDNGAETAQRFNRRVDERMIPAPAGQCCVRNQRNRQPKSNEMASAIGRGCERNRDMTPFAGRAEVSYR